jgi:hypothetical protein
MARRGERLPLNPRQRGELARVAAAGPEGTLFFDWIQAGQSLIRRGLVRECRERAVLTAAGEAELARGAVPQRAARA